MSSITGYTKDKVDSLFAERDAEITTALGAPDAAVAARVSDPTSATRAALNATYAPASGSPNYDAAGEALVNALIFGGK